MELREKMVGRGISVLWLFRPTWMWIITLCSNFQPLSRIRMSVYISAQALCTIDILMFCASILFSLGYLSINAGVSYLGQVKTIARIVEGDAGKVICNEAERLKPAAVIMGTRGRGLVQRFLFSSLSIYALCIYGIVVLHLQLLLMIFFLICCLQCIARECQ